MKKAFVVISVILCLFSVFTAFTAFADDGYRTNVVLTVEETTQYETKSQSLTQTDETTALKATENIVTTVTKDDSKFIKTGDSDILTAVILFILIALTVVVLWVTKKKYNTKE